MTNEELEKELHETQKAIANIVVSCVRDIGAKDAGKIISSLGLIQKSQSEEDQ